jgi:hypothetical protein
MSETLQAATKIREAETPVGCASCGGQYPDRRHIDFSAAYDGAVLNQKEVLESGVTPVQIDDLILCDECVRAAAALLGLVDPDDLGRVNASVMEANEELGERLTGALLLIDNLEKAAKLKETLAEQIKPKRQTKPKGD